MTVRGTALGRSLLIAAVAVLVVGAWLPQIQALADEQVDAGLKRALVSFASARTLNGLISVLQGTEFSVQPLGVGVTLTVGQALDPINDLIEQFSTLMLYASVAFGVQKALLAIGGSWAVSLLVSATALVWAGLYARRTSPPWLSRLLLVLLMIRFAIPVVTLSGELLYRQLLAKDYEQQQESIDEVSAVIRRATPPLPAMGTKSSPSTIVAPAPNSPLRAESTAKPAPEVEQGLIRRLWDQVTPGTSAAEGAPGATPPPPAGEAQGFLGRLADRVGGAVPMPDFDAIKASVDGLAERIVRLIVTFLLQTMIIPVVLLWALYRVALVIARP